MVLIIETELCKIGSEEQDDWYFFSHKDKKYPSGTRTNRATKAGFWKATGRDKPIYANHFLIGLRKTLVFYKGRAPYGHKSDWICMSIAFKLIKMELLRQVFSYLHHYYQLKCVKFDSTFCLYQHIITK